MSRIQSILCTDYKSINDIILLESSFAETDKSGQGIRQVYLGLSTSNLFLAADVVGGACCVDSSAPSGRDRYLGNLASESLRLVSMFPLDYVHLTVYRERTRYTIKLSFYEEHTRVRYFELGSCGCHDNRAMHWGLWKNRIEKMRSYHYHGEPMTSSQAFQNDVITVQSETSVGTSDTKSSQPICMTSSAKRSRTFDTMGTQEEVLCDLGHIHCLAATTLRAVKWSPTPYASLDLYSLAEDAVLLWEKTRNASHRKHCSRHKKCVPQSNFCFGFGLTQTTRQEKHLLFVRKTKSSLTLTLDTWEPQFQLPITKRELVRNVSQFNLHQPSKESESSVLFWTAENFHQRSPQGDYLEALRLRNAWNLNSKMSSARKPKLTGLWRKFKHMTVSKNRQPNWSDKEEKNGDSDTRERQKTIEMKNIKFPTVSTVQNKQINFKISRHRITTHRESLFRIHHDIHISDCDIQLVAQQLTLIEAALLGSIPVQELIIVANEKSTQHTPHIQHTGDFSHRISCLVASEICNTVESVQNRAKVVAKFILIADQCCKLHNFQSSCSILYGLQSPPVYRLARTWSYVRKFHSRKYRLFTALCTTFQDPTLVSYVATISDTISEHACFILPLRYLLATLVNRVPSHSKSVNIGTIHCEIPLAHLLQKEPHVPCQYIKSGDYGEKIIAYLDSSKNCRIHCCNEINTKIYGKELPYIKADNQKYQSKLKNCHQRKLCAQTNQRNYEQRQFCPQNCESTNYSFLISNYRNVVRAIQLLILGQSVVQLYTLRPNETIEYLTKKEYKEDWVNFVLSKRLE